MELTKNADTRTLYIKNSKALIRNANKEEVSLSKYYIQRCHNWSPATIRMYKASLTYYASHESVPSELKQDIEIISQSEFIGVKKRTLKEKKLSQRKKKSVSDVEFETIKNSLLKKSATSSIAKQTLLFFLAGINSGLRPQEWLNATLHEQGGNIILRVKNAKNSNGRAHGMYRHLTYLATSQSVVFIKAHLASIKIALNKGGVDEEDKFRSYYEQCRKRLYSVHKKEFPSARSTICLYSCRHQFIANLKACNYTLPEIAALVGHAVDDTSVLHYGKKKVGKSNVKGELPNALKKEVDKIKLLYSGPIRKAQHEPTQDMDH
jgi:hypothetical protein